MKVLSANTVSCSAQIELSLKELGVLIQCMSEITTSDLLKDEYDFDLRIGISKSSLEGILNEFAAAFDQVKGTKTD